MKSHQQNSTQLMSNLAEEYSSQRTTVGGDIDNVVSAMNYLANMSYMEIKSSNGTDLEQVTNLTHVRSRVLLSIVYFVG